MMGGGGGGKPSTHSSYGPWQLDHKDMHMWSMCKLNYRFIVCYGNIGMVQQVASWMEFVSTPASW